MIRKFLTTWREKGRLAAIDTQPFDPSSLAAHLDLARVFSDPLISAAWPVDKAAVEAVLSSGAGSTNAGERRAIYYLIAALKPRAILEVGTHRGATTLLIAKAAPGAHLTTLDIFDASGPKTAAAKLGLEIRFLTRPALKFFDETDERFDFIFLDGDHSAPAVYQEIVAATEHLNPNGVIFLHDYHPNNRYVFKNGHHVAGPYLAVKRLMAENPTLDVLPLGKLPWETRAGEQATCLALLTAS